MSRLVDRAQAEARRGREEVQIVTRTWNCHAVPPGLELVAVVGGEEVVGHVMAAAGLLDEPSGEHQVVLGVAPLSVRPGVQRRGIGTALMTELVSRASAGGWPLAVVLGDPRYYRRFGFEPAPTLGISYRPVGPVDPYFMVRKLQPDAVSVGGEFSYCWELYPRGRDRYEGEVLPPYLSARVRLMCDYGAEVPLFPQSEFIESLVPAVILVRLKAWQEDFDRNFHWERGWKSTEARDRWARTAREIESELKNAFAGKAELVTDLWPLRREGTGEMGEPEAAP